MKVSIIGLGYIGLPTAALIASQNIPIYGVDIQTTVIKKIQESPLTCYIERDVGALIKEVMDSGYLTLGLQPKCADVFIIAVPTPFKGSHEPDLQYVEAAVRGIAPVLKPGNVVILESTSPVGTTEQLAGWLSACRPDLNFPGATAQTIDVSIAYCPERVLPGRVLHELVHNDRVIGGLTPECGRAAQAFYQLFVQGQCWLTDSRTAELSKLAENSFRDVNIAFANELSMICDTLNINIWELIYLANRHPRVHILQPGPGVGGHCIAVDPWFIISAVPEQAVLMKAARQVNMAKTNWVVAKTQMAIADYLQKHPNKTAQEVTIACLGLTYKANIDDCRESPAMAITKTLAQKHPGIILAAEPNITRLPEGLTDQITLQSYEQAINRSQIVLLLVDHQEFKQIPTDIWRTQQVIDVRGVFASSEMV